MHKLIRLLTETEQPSIEPVEAENLPLPVAEDWDLLVNSASRMADVIDKHLDFESKLQGRELRPVTLCPEQKVTLATDLSFV